MQQLRVVIATSQCCSRFWLQSLLKYTERTLQYHTETNAIWKLSLKGKLKIVKNFSSESITWMGKLRPNKLVPSQTTQFLWIAAWCKLLRAPSSHNGQQSHESVVYLSHAHSDLFWRMSSQMGKIRAHRCLSNTKHVDIHIFVGKMIHTRGGGVFHFDPTWYSYTKLYTR